MINENIFERVKFVSDVEEMKAYRFSMPLTYHTKLKVLAAQEKTSINALMVELVERLLTEKGLLEDR
jgi:hypothetical protein